MNTKTAMLIGEKFPGGRVEFLMKQVIKLLEIKPNSRVLVLHGKEKGYAEPKDIKKYNVAEKIDYLNIPGGSLNRILGLPSVLNHPLIFLKSLSKKYYPMNYTLKHYLVYNEVKKLPYRIDTIHCHFGQIGIIGAFLKNNKLCKKLIISFYGGDLTGYVSKYGKEIYKTTFENADYLIACTEFLRKKLIELGADPKKIILIRLPQNPKFFRPSERRKEDNNVRILTVARLVKEKGVQNAIAAVYLLSKKYENIKYIIVGDGAYREELMNLVKKYSLQKIVEFRGALVGEEALKEYQNADIFVLPSITTHNGWVEGGGLVNLEAQLCELPVVATRTGGIPEYVLDKVTGFLTEETPEDLAEKIALLIENKKLRKKMGKKGREIVKKKYSIKNLDKLEELYK